MGLTVLVSFNFWRLYPLVTQRGRGRDCLDLWAHPLSCCCCRSWSFRNAHSCSCSCSCYFGSSRCLSSQKCLSSLPGWTPQELLKSTFCFFAVSYVLSHTKQCSPKILLPLPDRTGHETRPKMVTGGL